MKKNYARLWAGGSIKKLIEFTLTWPCKRNGRREETSFLTSFPSFLFYKTLILTSPFAQGSYSSGRSRGSFFVVPSVLPLSPLSLAV